MAYAAVIGGGLAGCLLANRLADKGMEVIIVEKSEDIGGKVRDYGCKAHVKCNNCGLCLIGDLWENTYNNSKIQIMTDSELIDIFGNKGNYSLAIKTKNGFKVIKKINYIIVSIGFENFSTLSSSNLEFNVDSEDNIISGSKLEKIISYRRQNELFEGFYSQNPENIAFIQCFGSKDIKEKAMYCSRVCCAYSTRAAKVIKQYYPEIKITFFYMDLQWVEDKGYLNSLLDEKIEFIECRPISIKGGVPARIIYEDPKTCGVVEREYDLIVLSEGIHPPKDGDQIVEICMLAKDDNGFLKYVKQPKTTGIYVVGCAEGPKKIEEIYTQTLVVANEINEEN